MDTIASGHAAALWVGLHVFLLLTLALLVVRLRQKHKVAMGDEGIPELARAIRAFGNASEYIPIGLAAIIVLVLVDAPPLAVHVVGLILFAGRLIHAVGLSNSGGASIARSIGMICTWVAYVFGGVALLFYAIG